MNQILTYRVATLKPSTMDTLTMNNTVSKELNVVIWWEVLLMFFILSISGNPYIGSKKFELFTMFSAIIPFVHIVRNYKKSVSYRTIFIFVFLLGYEIMHAFMFKLDYTITFFKLTLILLLSAVTVDILKNKFIVVLTKTMVLISLVSFAFVLLSYTPLHETFYILASKMFPVNEYNGVSTPTILIFTFCREYFDGELPYVRNAGIFWESGAFAVFLNITLFLNYSSKSIKSVRDLFDRDSIILILALISTTSTMGVLSLLMVFGFFSAQLKSIFKYVLLVLLFIVGYLAFTNVDFIGEKINKQLKESKSSNNRFGSALKDWENISERPLLGWSRRIEVVFNTSVYSNKTHRPNGFTNFLRSYGFVYFTVYFLLVFHSFKNIYLFHHYSYNIYVPLFGVILLCIVSFSELIFDLAFLKSLIFIYSAYYSTRESIGQHSIKKYS